MAINREVEHGGSNMNAGMKEPFIKQTNSKDRGDELHGKSSNNGSLATVLLSTFVAVLGSFEFGSCVGFTTPTQLAIIHDLDLSIAEFSFFGSLLTVGGIIGATTSGRISDLVGRKEAMRMSAIVCITGWIAIHFSKGVLSLYAGRFLTGCGIGVFSFVVPIYIAEIAPKNLRGGLATVNQIMIVTGSSTAFLTGTVLEWQLLALTGIIPCLVQLLGLFYIPESPRWLAKVGDRKQFDNALRKLRGDDANISLEAAEIQDSLANQQHQPQASMLDLFQKRYQYPVTIGVGLMAFQQFGGINGIGFYASQVLVSAGFPSGKIGIVAFACLQVPVTALGAFLVDNCGRRPLLLVSATGTFLGCFLLGTSFLMKEHNMLQKWTPVFVLSGILLYVASFSVGIGAVPWVLMSEIFPINVKGAAGSLVNLVHWLGAWIVSYSFNLFMEWSSSGTFFLYAGICAATVLFVAKVVPETKGKTLEEIQTSLNA